ncbi:MAG: GH25 family lysozyme, partial [Bacteroidota bacterium]
MKNFLSIIGLCLFLCSCNRSTERLEGFAVHGIDVSHHQLEINWDTVATQRIDFAFIKATEGRDFQDHCFTHNWQELKRVDIKRGAYHFFHPTLSAETKAANVIRTVDRQFGDLPPVLDFEVVNDVAKEEVIQKVRTWLAIIERYYKIRPIIYTNQKLYFQYIRNNFADYPIWMARYNILEPIMLAENDWQFWQYGNKGSVKGINGNVDLNVFNGELL